jgi:1,4-dihydroxy-2-naphthoate polyprenyltransferase
MTEAVRRLRPIPAPARWLAYGRLAKLGVYQHWTPLLVAWSLLPPPLSVRAWLVLALFLVAVLSLAAAGAALDDVQGARDGLDRAAYGHRQESRDVRRKPLLAGDLGERQALRFGRRLGALGVVAGTAAVAVAPHQPVWLLVMFLIGGLAATQYAYGLKLSYLGGGEWLLGILTAGTVTIPVALVTGVADWPTTFAGVLVGWLFVQVTLFSNAADAPADRAADRLTIAARLSRRAGKRYVAATFAVGWVITAAGLAVGALPGLLAVGLIPVWALQLGQLRAGLRDERWLRARALGWRALDFGVIAVVGANIADRAL